MSVEVEAGVHARGVKLPPLIHYLAYSLVIGGFTLLVPGVYGILFHFTEPREYRVASELLAYGVFIFSLGVLVSRLTTPTRRLTPGEALALVVLTWILIPLIVAIPVAEVLDIPFVDAWFESVSGFTTTGLTMFNGAVDREFGVYVPSVEELPKTILFWRSFIQWVGGVGIVVVAVSILARPGSAARLLYMAEGRTERIEPSIVTTAKRIVAVYLVVTIFDAFLLYFAGMPLFDAVNHAMTGIATGGFSTKNNSIAEFHNVHVEVAAIVVMISGAISFSDLYNLVFRGRVRRFLQSPELRAMLVIIALATLANMLPLLAKGYSLGDSLRYSSFQVVTTVTGTGFQNTGLGEDKPVAFKHLLTLLCLLGGAAFSTTGGVKMLRILIAVKSVLWEARASYAPPGYTPRRRLAWIVIDEANARRALTVIFAFTVTMVIGTFIASLILPDKPLEDVALETASALGNVGVSTGITGAHSPLALKLLYIVLMLLGRLEILPYFYVLHMTYVSLVRKIRASRHRSILERRVELVATRAWRGASR